MRLPLQRSQLKKHTGQKELLGKNNLFNKRFGNNADSYLAVYTKIVSSIYVKGVQCNNKDNPLKNRQIDTL